MRLTTAAGALITGVSGGGIASAAKPALASGDVVRKLNGEAVATLDPQIVANAAQPNTVAAARPPGMRPSHFCPASKALWESPAANAICPMNRNNGSTT